jgi:hypothetical protein
MIKQIMNKLFLSCLKASELIEKKMHVRLSFNEQMQLKAHKMMCEACTTYEKQSLILEKGIEQHLHQNKETIDLEQLKKQILLNLNKSEN